MIARLLAAAILGFAFAVPATYLARIVARRFGMVALPKGDRWHAREVPLLGGMAILAAALFPLVVLRAWNVQLLILLTGAVFLAGMGLLDDRRALKPSTKFVVQLACASVLVFSGFRPEIFASPLANSLLGIVWIVGITNAFNLLDNMDGLCAGIATIAVIAFVVERAVPGAPVAAEVVYAAGLAGALVGFLLFNFQPASIFMGDTGSLFIGSSLAALTIMPGAAGAANVITVLAVPALMLAIPIFDTGYVTLLRKMAGRPASQGGRDHTSHRLVALGFSERGAVLLLYVLGIASGTLAILVRQVGIRHVNVVVALLLLVLLLIGVRLAQLQIYQNDEVSALGGRGLTPLLVNVMYKRRLFEIGLDCLLIVLAYYAAYWVRFENLNENDFRVYYDVFLRSLPIVLACKIVAFLAAGIYGGVWQYFSLSDLGTYARGLMLASAASILAVLYLFRYESFSRGVFIIDGVFLALLLVGSRISFRALGETAQRGSHQGRKVLVYGAGYAGGIVIRELLNNRSHNLLPVGFIDDDPGLKGSRIQGYPVLGGLDVLPTLIAERDVEVIVLSTSKLPRERMDRVCALARESGTALSRLEFRLDQLVNIER
jgi:UDP-GlcNAc:undecaprenyl-phosphate GlcNAc-1-phosphate transferase